MTHKTKKQLEQQLKAIIENKERIQDQLENAEERNKIAALYLQTLRVMFNRIGGMVIDTDFNRLLDVLEHDRFPEGF